MTDDERDKAEEKPEPEPLSDEDEFRAVWAATKAGDARAINRGAY